MLIPDIVNGASRCHSLTHEFMALTSYFDNLQTLTGQWRIQPNAHNAVLHIEILINHFWTFTPDT